MTHSYIKQLKMSGYKSIKDLECDLQSGLNIIIGKNGSGKTNFFEMMYMCLNGVEPNASEYNFNINYTERNKLEIRKWIFEGKKKNFLNQDRVEESDDNKRNINLYLRPYKKPIFVKYSSPDFIPFLKDKVEIEIIENGVVKFNDKIEIGSSFLIYSFEEASKYTYNRNIDIQHQNANELNISSSINEKLNTNFFYEKLNENINILKQEISIRTPIKDIRLTDFVKENSSSNRIKFSGLVLEFFVNDEWLEWQKLSDGSKRMIYLIDKVLTYKKIEKHRDSYFNPILIEEPELGIHPHQLHLLMQFLKDQAKERQIIITTHSPQVLDVLEKDELKNILIAEMKKNGTQMRHLSEREMAKATAYMEDEDLLSAYWRFSDFNRE